MEGTHPHLQRLTHTDVHRLRSSTAPLPTITEPCRGAQPAPQNPHGASRFGHKHTKMHAFQVLPLPKGPPRKTRNQSDEWRDGTKRFWNCSLCNLSFHQTAYTKLTKFFELEKTSGIS